MTREEFNELPLGLYKIKWKEGRCSLAAIGSNSTGDRWLAPCNWVYLRASLVPLDETINSIKKVKLIKAV